MKLGKQEYRILNYNHWPVPHRVSESQFRHAGPSTEQMGNIPQGRIFGSSSKTGESTWFCVISFTYNVNPSRGKSLNRFHNPHVMWNLSKNSAFNDWAWTKISVLRGQGSDLGLNRWYILSKVFGLYVVLFQVYN